MVQTSAPLSDKPSSVGEMEGKKSQGLDQVALTQMHSVAPLYSHF